MPHTPVKPPRVHADTLYAQSRQIVDAFAFDDAVATVFSDMIQRSVPGYTLMLDLLSVVTEATVQANSHCYDLGCSLGASTLAMRRNIPVKGVSIVGVDNSSAMISRCQQVLDNDHSTSPVSLIQGDINAIAFEPTSLVCMNLTLQFIDVELRSPLLQRISAAMLSGGVLFLSEKITTPDTFAQQQLTDLHHQFKQHQGYSALEVAQKRAAIENILIPESLETHTQRLLDAGFSKVVVALQCLNFVTLLAYK